jgi:hypothetical protein
MHLQSHASVASALLDDAMDEIGGGVSTAGYNASVDDPDHAQAMSSCVRDELTLIARAMGALDSPATALCAHLLAGAPATGARALVRTVADTPCWQWVRTVDTTPPATNLPVVRMKVKTTIDAPHLCKRIADQVTIMMRTR